MIWIIDWNPFDPGSVKSRFSIHLRIGNVLSSSFWTSATALDVDLAADVKLFTCHLSWQLIPPGTIVATAAAVVFLFTAPRAPRRWNIENVQIPGAFKFSLASRPPSPRTFLVVVVVVHYSVKLFKSNHRPLIRAPLLKLNQVDIKSDLVFITSDAPGRSSVPLGFFSIFN